MNSKKATDYYIAAFKKYADFSGRAQRAEYWYFVLFNLIISMVLSYFDRLIGNNSLMSVGFLGGIFSLVVLIPGLAVAVRRLHDIGKSGWMILISFIPIIGFIWLIVLLATDSNPGDNEYGSNPKGVTVT